MTSIALDLPRRFPWPTLLSVGIHGGVVAAFLYASVHHQVIELPASSQPIMVTMATPSELAPPQAVQPPTPPQAVVEPAPEPVVPKAAVVIHKPEPKPRPKPKPKTEVKKTAPPKPEVKPVASPDHSQTTTPSSTTNNPIPATAAPSVNAAPLAPRVLSQNQPTYPARALALRIEGSVRVKFDVTADGSVDNVEILSAQPANMFERDVKTAMRKWRYEAGKPGNGLIMNIEFRLKGVQIH